MSGIGISVIGTPHGIESKSTGIAKGLTIDSLVDIPNTIINVLPQTDILRVRREGPSSSSRIYYIYYRFAKETDSSRTGGFYGSAVVLDSCIGDSILLLQALYDLADIVNNECLDSDERFQKNIKSLTFKLPESVRLFKSSLKPESFNTVTKPRGPVFIPVDDSGEFKAYFEFLENYTFDPILSEFQDIFLSTSPKVLSIVKERKGLAILNYANLHEERQRELEIQKQRELEERRRHEELEREEFRKKERLEREERERQQRIKNQQLEQQKKEQEQERRAAEIKKQQERNTQKAFNTSAFGDSKKPLTDGELKQHILRTNNLLDDIERRVFPERFSVTATARKKKTPRWIKASTDFFRRTAWWKIAIVLALAVFFAFVGYLGWVYFFSNSQASDSDLISSRRQSSPTLPSQDSRKNSEPPARVQLNYVGSRTEKIKTVKELAEFIRTTCPGFCASGISVQEIVDSLVKINPSMRDKMGQGVIGTNDRDVLNFPLKDISGTVTFEVPICCDVSKNKPSDFEQNAPSPK